MSIERMKKRDEHWRCRVSSDLWLDYVEGTLDQELFEDLTRHKNSCAHCEKNFMEFHFVRQQLKGPVKDLPDDLFFKKLEKNIMASVEKTHPEIIVPMGQRHLKTVAMATAAMLILIVGMPYLLPKMDSLYSWSGSKKISRLTSSEDQMIWQNASGDPALFGGTITSHQDSDDFVLDAAAEKLSRMSDTDARTALDKMK